MNAAALLLLVCAGATSASGLPAYRSARTGGHGLPAHGQPVHGLPAHGPLVITSTSGRRLVVPELPGQTGFSQVRISADHHTVGWLAEFPDAAVPGGTLSGRLLLFRAGRVVQRYPTDQVFWTWNFSAGGVAFCTGPTHGGPERCELHSASGRLRAFWAPRGPAPAPQWVNGFRF